METSKSSETSSSETSSSEEDDFVCATRFCFQKLYIGHLCYACYILKLKELKEKEKEKD